MAILFDKDPLTGVTQYYDYDPINDIHMIHNVQDFTPLVEKLKQKGIDIYNKDQTKELLKEINTNYPWLKTTTKKHG